MLLSVTNTVILSQSMQTPSSQLNNQEIAPLQISAFKDGTTFTNILTEPASNSKTLAVTPAFIPTFVPASNRNQFPSTFEDSDSGLSNAPMPHGDNDSKQSMP